MKKISSALVALSLFCSSAPAFAAETVPVTQPENGFYQTPDPEWSTLHSTDTRGTAEHRTYHRQAVSDHLAWHAEHKAEQETPAFKIAHRIFHQMRNILHRQFHTAPVNPA